MKKHKILKTSGWSKVVKLGSSVSQDEILEQDGYSCFRDTLNNFINEDILNSEFSKCLSMLSSERINDSKIEFNTDDIFKHNKLDVYLDVYKKKDSNLYCIIRIYYKIDEDLENIINYLNKNIIYKEEKVSKVSIILKGSAGFMKKSCDIEPLDLSIGKMYNDDFQPVYDKIINSLINDSKGILMLHGEPGTGKTNFIKYLTTLVTKKDFIFVPTNMIHYLTDPDFLQFLLQNTNSILVLEDCENYIKERGQSSNDAVSTLLNLSDGIMSDILKIQIICTFNGKISAIDKALLRKGRLIAEYEFKPLEENKAIELAEMLNVELPAKRTLTEIFNANEKTFTTVKDRSIIGFKV